MQRGVILQYMYPRSDSQEIGAIFKLLERIQMRKKKMLLLTVKTDARVVLISVPSNKSE